MMMRQSGVFVNLKKKITGFNILIVLFTTCFLVSFLFPLYWQVVTSLKTRENTFAVPPQLFPNPLSLEYYKWVIDNPFMLSVRNSVIVSSSTTLICLVTSTLASYALARLRIPGNRIILLGVLVVSMLPAMALLGPLYLMFKQLKLINTFVGLIIAYTAFFLPFTMWFLTSFFKTIPVELEESAEIDGCTPFQALYKIIIPLSAPAVFTVMILVFIFSWNEFLVSFTLMSTDPVRTYPVGLVMMQGQWEVPWGEMMAAATIVAVPIITLVLVAQRFIIQGLTAGALKG
jgi:multiple sugar transport system permease protein